MNNGKCGWAHLVLESKLGLVGDLLERLSDPHRLVRHEPHEGQLGSEDQVLQQDEEEDPLHRGGCGGEGTYPWGEAQEGAVGHHRHGSQQLERSLQRCGCIGFDSKGV